MKRSRRRRKKGHCKVCRASLKRRGMYGAGFCTRSCSDEWDYQVYVRKWLSGKEPGGSPGRLSRYVRRWVYSKRGRKCERCGWDQPNPETGKVPVEINHIDGDSSNHTPENLEVLCPNCHSLTQYHGSLNYGNGRKSRLKDELDTKDD